MKGSEVPPLIASKLALYSYCVAFHVDPMIAYQTPSKLILEMLTIHGEVKKIEQEEIDKAMK